MSSNEKDDFNTSAEGTAKNVENEVSNITSSAANTAGNKVKKSLRPVVHAATKALGQALKTVVAVFGKYLLMILAIVLIGALIIASIWYVQKAGIHKSVKEKTKTVISDTISTSIDNGGNSTDNINFSSVATIEGSDESGYYIKISSEVIDNIIKGLEEEDIDPEDLGLDSFDCFRRFIEAEIMTQFPNLGKENTNLKQNGKDIIVNGCINIQRAQVNKKGETKLINLKYTALDNFNKMVEENDEKSLDYFSLNKEGELLIASYYKNNVVVTTSGDTSFIDVPSGEDTYNISLTNINYKDSVNKYSMPFMFLIALLETSNSEQMALDFAKLAKNTKIDITIEDNIEITNTTESISYVKKYEGNKKFGYQIIATDTLEKSVKTMTVEGPTTRNSYIISR